MLSYSCLSELIRSPILDSVNDPCDKHNVNVASVSEFLEPNPQSKTKPTIKPKIDLKVGQVVLVVDTLS
jgi:hypothetical protein